MYYLYTFVRIGQVLFTLLLVFNYCSIVLVPDMRGCTVYRAQNTRGLRANHPQIQGGRKRLPKFKFSAKFPIGLHVILQIQIKKSKMTAILCEKLF